MKEPEQRSRYSDWLRVGRQRDWSSSPDTGEIFLVSTSPRPLLGLIQPPIQWVPGALSPAVKRPGREVNHLKLVPKLRILYNHSPVRLDGVVLNYLSAGILNK
jgi:hypothetical protein